MANGKELTLGVLFKGEISDSMKNALNQLETIVKGLNKSLDAMGKSAGAADKSIKGLESEFTSFQQVMNKARDESLKFREALATLATGKTGAALKSVEANLYKVEKAVQQTAQRMNVAGKSGDKFAKSVNRIKLNSQILAGKLKIVNGEFVRVGVSSKKADAGMNTAGATSKKLSGNLTFMGKQIGSVDGAYKRLMGAFKVTVSYGIAATAIYSVINAMKSGVQSIIDYDQGLKNLQAITSATGFEVAAMGETIKTVARDTKFSTSEAADGMTLLGQAGLTAGESMTAMRDTALLATGTMSEMKTSTDLVSTAIRAFDIAASDSGRIVDTMANAVNKSKLTIDKLRTSFNYVGATAAQAGLSIEEVAATMMNLANSGLRASTIGTGLRQVLSKVLKPSEKLSATLASVGLTLDDINPSMVGWGGTLKSLASILYDTETKTVDMSKAFSLFGLRGAQAAAVVVKAFVSGKYTDALSKVYEIGTAEEMAAKQAEGLAVKLKNLVDRAGNVAVAFGEAGAANGIRVFLDAVREMLGVLESFAGSVVGKVIVQLGAIAGAFKFATMAGKAFLAVMMKMTAIEAIVMTFRGLATTMTGKTGLAGAFATVGSYLKTFLKSLNLVTIALGVVATAILAYRAALANSIKEAEKAAVKNMQLVDSLEAYQGGLVSTGEKAIKLKDDIDLAKSANDAYIATLNRLIKAHPELASKIELSIDAYEHNNEVVKEFASEAHAEKVRSLVGLYNEYGEAGERAKVWAGVWVLTKESVSLLADITGKFFSNLSDWIQVGLNNWGKFFAVIGSMAGKLGLDKIGTLFQSVGGSITNLKDRIIDTLAEMGKGSKEVEALSLKQKEVVNTLTLSYIGLGDKAKLSYNEILTELRKLSTAENEITATMQMEIVKRVRANRDAMGKYTHDVAESLLKMNDLWREYYNKQDIHGKFEVQQEFERLQKKYKKYENHLNALFAAKKINEQEMAAESQKWWAKELAGYKENLEKKGKAHSNFADKIRSIEAKLADDKKAIRQADMSDEAIKQESMIAARQALSDAIKAVSKAETSEDQARAIEKIEIARKAYSDIASDAIANTKKIKVVETTSAAESVAAIKASNEEKATSYEDAMDRVITARNKVGEFERAARNQSAAENEKRLKLTSDIEAAELEAMEALRDKYAQQDLERIAKTFGENSKQLKNYEDSLIAFHGREKAEKIAGRKLHTEVEKGKADATEASYNKMKTAAENAFAVIEQLLIRLKEKFSDPAVLKTDIEASKNKIKEVEQGVDKTKTKIEKPMKVDVKTNEAKKNIDDLANKGEKLSKFEKQYKLEIENREALKKLGFTDDAINRMSVSLRKAIAQGKIGIDVETTNANANLKTMTKAAEAATKAITEPKIFQMDAKDGVEGISEITTKSEAAKTVITEPKVFEVNTITVDKALDVTKEKADGIKTTLEGPTKVTVDTTAGNKAIDDLNKKLTAFVKKKWTSTHTIVTKGLQTLKNAINYQKNVAGETNTTSTHTIITKKKEGNATGGPVGLNNGGKIQGYGGGDTVPAMLEKGEFVIRKEAVQKYGQGLFESLNSMAKKMSVGGFVMPKIEMPKFAQGGPVASNQMSGKLHTINLNINNSPHKLYGDTDAVNGLVKTLRRAQLVTA